MNTTAFKRVLWKDWQQIQSPVVVLTVLFCSIQTIFIAHDTFRIRWLPTASDLGLSLIHSLTLAVPLTMAAVVTGTLVSQQRGRRTWDWSSSLPAPWYLGFFSQFANWFFSVVIALTPMFALATYAPIPQAYQAQFGDMFVNFLLIGLELVVWFSILMLVFEDSATGMLLGLATFVFYELVMGIISPLVIFGDVQLQEIGRDRTMREIGHIVRLVLFALGLIVSYRMFRWRWTTGQDFQLSISGPFGGSVRKETRTRDWNSVLTSSRQPGESKITIVHTLRSMAASHLTLITITVSAAVLICLGAQRWGDRPAVFSIAVLFLFSGVLPTAGIMAFSPDQFRNRFRFFADRGIGPIRFAAFRIAMALSTATLAVLIGCVFAGSVEGFGQGSLNESPFEVWVALWFPAIAVTSLGIYSSLCFSRTTFAFIAASVAAATGWILFSMFVFEWVALLDVRRPYLGKPGEFFVTHGSVVTTITMTMFTIAGVRRWMIADRFSGVRWFVCSCATALAASLVIVIAISLLGLE